MLSELQLIVDKVRFFMPISADIAEIGKQRQVKIRTAKLKIKDNSKFLPKKLIGEQKFK